MSKAQAELIQKLTRQNRILLEITRKVMRQTFGSDLSQMLIQRDFVLNVPKGFDGELETYLAYTRAFFTTNYSSSNWNWVDSGTRTYLGPDFNE
jgi:hypothetical protein